MSVQVTQDSAWKKMDVLCPMHARLDGAGVIVHAGPTLAKLRPETELVGAFFLDVFELLRPNSITTMQDLRARFGAKLHLQFRSTPRTGLKGVMVADGDGAIVNLSFGISLLDAARDYALSGQDFAATDLTIEMLYLIEAKSAAMEASRQLNLRLQGAKIAAEEQAFTDTLTGLKNRRAMDHILARMIAAKQSFALMHLDLDYFKAVNDTLGHGAGDHVLQKVARILVEQTRRDDTVARVGGDEFVLIFHDLTNREQLEHIAKRMIRRLEEPVPYQDKLCQISGSAGTVLSETYEHPDAARMLEDADIALYHSKRQGRAQHTFFTAELRDPGNVPPSVRGENAA